MINVKKSILAIALLSVSSFPALSMEEKDKESLSPSKNLPINRDPLYSLPGLPSSTPPVIPSLIPMPVPVPIGANNNFDDDQISQNQSLPIKNNDSDKKEEPEEEDKNFLPLGNVLESLLSVVDSDKKEEPEEKTPKCKSRLFLGEADFSYTVALLEKHKDDKPGLKNAITTTELSSKEELLKLYPDTFPKNLGYLERSNVNIQFGIDATNIHNIYNGQIFRRIHFNFPHDGKNFKDENLKPIEDLALPKIITAFFKSAWKLQEEGDRIHVTLPKENERFREAFQYRIEDARKEAGYRLIKKHKFNEDRYLGYNHRMTTANIGASIADGNGREYIFEKAPLPEEVKNEISPKKYVYKKNRNLLPSINTDDESSDYEDEEILFEEEVFVNNFLELSMDRSSEEDDKRIPVSAFLINDLESAEENFEGDLQDLRTGIATINTIESSDFSNDEKKELINNKIKDCEEIVNTIGDDKIDHQDIIVINMQINYFKEKYK